MLQLFIIPATTLLYIFAALLVTLVGIVIAYIIYFNILIHKHKQEIDTL